MTGGLVEVGPPRSPAGVDSVDWPPMAPPALPVPPEDGSVGTVVGSEGVVSDVGG
jgi:hypothetical protein